MKAFLVSGDRSGAGKTSITLALAAILAREETVQTYKVAMDYIDTSYLAGVTGRPAYNLDSVVQTDEEMAGLFAFGAEGAGYGVVEGVRGLFEGRDAFSDAGSTAAVARRFGLPVILVLNARSITRSAAAVVMGFQHFDPEVHIAGVILNNTGPGRHVEKAKAAIEYYCGVPVLGAVPRSDDMSLSMRHLGLVPFREGLSDAEFSRRLERLIAHVEAHVDMDAVRSAAKEVFPEQNAVSRMLSSPVPAVKTVAVAVDEAFNFYYGELDAVLGSIGCRVIPFSPIHDVLPEADGYIFGGGYPELFARELAENSGMRDAVRRKAEEGVPMYAECGGLMYLCRSISLKKGWRDVDRDGVYPMCGVFAGDAVMPAVKTLGYVEGTAVVGGVHMPVRGHEFHYSGVAMDEGAVYAYRLSRGAGVEKGQDGVVYKRALGAYTHQMPVAAREFFKEVFR